MRKKRDDIDELVAKHRAKQEDDSDSDPDVAKPKKPFVDYFSFNLLIGFLITVNALTMGLETDARGEVCGTVGTGADAEWDCSNVSGIWYLIEVVFCLIFVAEVAARIWYHRIAFFCHPAVRAWNIADFCIVLLSVADAFIITPIGMGGNVRLVSMLRFIRLMRLIRLVRLMRLFKELWLVANGLIESAKTLCWVALMIICFIYICAIFTTVAIGKNDEVYDAYFMESGGWDHEVYFKTVPRSMFTLFQIITFESWSERIVRHVMQKQPAMVVFFVCFIAVTSFGLLNIVVGVVVESTLSTSEKDDNKIKRQQERDRQRVFDHLRDIFEAADEDGSGTLTLGEVQKAINKPEIYNKLKMIDFPVEDPKQIFMLLDYDNSCELSIDEFIAGCIRMKGSAKSKDLLAAQVAVDTMKRHYSFFETEMKELQEKIALLDETARALVFQGEHVFLNLREYRLRHPEMEGGRSTLPVVNMHEVEGSPWEKAARAQSLAVLQQQAQAQKWNDAFQQPDQKALQDALAAVPYHLRTTAASMFHGMGATMNAVGKVGAQSGPQAIGDASRRGMGNTGNSANTMTPKALNDAPINRQALPPPPGPPPQELMDTLNSSPPRSNGQEQLQLMDQQGAPQGNQQRSTQRRGNVAQGDMLALPGVPNQ